MTYGEKLAHIFQMNDTVWENHTNPWSVWTRYLGLPLLVISVWSRIWWRWWSILPITIVMIWIWINPRIFPKPKTTQNWSSKAVLGERVWLNQKNIPIPQHHQTLITFTNAVNAIGFVICVWGLINLEIWPTILGLSWVILAKTWFLDRMVWLFTEMKDHPEYRDWLY